jgi:hypothetical protein
MAIESKIATEPKLTFVSWNIGRGEACAFVYSFTNRWRRAWSEGSQ